MMDRDKLNSIIRGLEDLEIEQERELSQTREMILSLKGRRERNSGEVLAPLEPQAIDPHNATYGQLCVSYLKEHGGPMHIALIMEKLSKSRGVEMSRPAIQTCLRRLTEKFSYIEKVGRGTFQYLDSSAQ